MSEADKMFEELGYKLKPRTTSRSYSLKYYKDDDNVIYFDDEREIHKDGEYAETCYGITIPELKAINQKCKELGWLEDDQEYEEDFWDIRTRMEMFGDD